MKRLVAVILALFAALYFAPVLFTAIGSTMTATEIAEVYGGREQVLRLIPRRVTLAQYYKVLLGNGAFVKLFAQSLLLCASITVAGVAVSLIAAYLFAKVRFRGRDKLFFVYIVVMLMPFQVTLLPNYLLAKWLRVYDTWWALIIPAVFSPFGVFLLRQFIVGITDETIESAILETRSPLIVLKNIVAPAIWPGVLALAVFQFAESWNMVEQPMILLETPSKYPLSLALNDLLRDSSVALAGSMVYMTPIIVAYNLFRDELLGGFQIGDGQTGRFL